MHPCTLCKDGCMRKSCIARPHGRSKPPAARNCMNMRTDLPTFKQHRHNDNETPYRYRLCTQTYKHEYTCAQMRTHGRSRIHKRARTSAHTTHIIRYTHKHTQTHTLALYIPLDRYVHTPPYIATEGSAGDSESMLILAAGRLNI